MVLGVIIVVTLLLAGRALFAHRARRGVGTGRRAARRRVEHAARRAHGGDHRRGDAGRRRAARRGADGDPGGDESPPRPIVRGRRSPVPRRSAWPRWSSGSPRPGSGSSRRAARSSSRRWRASPSRASGPGSPAGPVLARSFPVSDPTHATRAHPGAAPRRHPEWSATWMPGREPRTDARHPPSSGPSARSVSSPCTPRPWRSSPRGLFNSMFAVGVVGRIVHTERRVVVVRARLRPPSRNTAVHLLGDPQTRPRSADARGPARGPTPRRARALRSRLPDYEVDTVPHTGAR